MLHRSSSSLCHVIRAMFILTLPYRSSSPLRRHIICTVLTLRRSMVLTFRRSIRTTCLTLPRRSSLLLRLRSMPEMLRFYLRLIHMVLGTSLLLIRCRVHASTIMCSIITTTTTTPTS